MRDVHRRARGPAALNPDEKEVKRHDLASKEHEVFDHAISPRMPGSGWNWIGTGLISIAIDKGRRRTGEQSARTGAILGPPEPEYVRDGDLMAWREAFFTRLGPGHFPA